MIQKLMVATGGVVLALSIITSVILGIMCYILILVMAGTPLTLGTIQQKACFIVGWLR